MGLDTYDVAIIGAGPAGACAAIMLAQQERSVALIERDTYPRKTRLFGWLNVRATDLLTKMGVATKGLLTERIKEVVFHNADFSKRVKPNLTESPGYLVDLGVLDNALVARAVDCGVTLLNGCEAVDVDLAESSATVRLRDGRDVKSRLLLLALGGGSTLAERAGFPRLAREQAAWSAVVEESLKGASGNVPRVGIVLGLGNAESFGLYCVSKSRISVAVNWNRERGTTVTALEHLCRSGFDHDAIPIDLSRKAAQGKAIRSPTSIALDLESHVGKHTLLIGDAGGFVSALSNEGVFPAMWSAQIAAEITRTALDSVHSQDALMKFDSEWRIQMADYLRPPNTDNQFLLPLIFSNQPMADRMAAAFFWGENI